MVLNKIITTYYPDVRPYTLTSMAYEVRENGVCIAYFDTQKNLHALTLNQMHETFFVLEPSSLSRLRWTFFLVAIISEPPLAILA